jgi:hypothetical protein
MERHVDKYRNIADKLGIFFGLLLLVLVLGYIGIVTYLFGPGVARFPHVFWLPFTNMLFDKIHSSSVLTYILAYFILYVIILAYFEFTVGLSIMTAWFFFDDKYLRTAPFAISIISNIILAVWIQSPIVPNIIAKFDIVDIARFAPVALLTIAAIFIVILLIVSALIGTLRRRSQKLQPDAHMVHSLFEALWRLQRAGTKWTALDTRAQAMDDVARASAVARWALLNKFQSADRDLQGWRMQQASRISAALSDKEKWLMTPKTDTRDALFVSLGTSMITLLSGNWDKLEMIVDPVGEGRTAQVTPRRTLDIVVNSGRTALIAVFPLALFLLADFAGILADVDPRTHGYIKIGLFTWAALTVLFRLDPLLKEKIATLKEAAQMLKPGSTKE